jgi:ssDNA-binding Zn-finger/Zn-ribbon topoisomerase 1
MILKNGKYGKFYGCSEYPECSYTANKEVVDRLKDELEKKKAERLSREDEREMESANEGEDSKEFQEYEEKEITPDSELEDYDEDGVYIDPSERE